MQRVLVTMALALAVAFHAWMLWSLHSTARPVLYHDSYHLPGPGVDFYAIYHAGQQVRHGRDPYAYAPEQRAPDMPMYAPFRYLPGVASTLGAALSTLSPQAAYRVWLVLLELVLIADLWLLRSVLPQGSCRQLARAAWLCFTPLYLEYWMGQFTLVMASLLLWGAIAWRAARGRAAALCWAAAALLKLLGFALVPWLLRQRQWLALAAGGVVCAASALWFAQHPTSWNTFWQQNAGFHAHDLYEFHAGNLGLQSLLFHVSLLFGVPSVEAWRWVAFGLPLVLGAFGVFVLLRTTSPGRAVTLCLLLLPLAFKHVWEHHYVALLPAMSLLLAEWSGERRRCVLLAVCFVLLALPTPFALQPGAPGTNPELEWTVELRLLHHAVKPLPALALFVALVSDARRGSTARARSASSD